MDLSKIPNRLRGEPYFCLMKFEKKPGKDKKDKVPYRTNGTRADPTNPEHFTSLENVMKVFDKGGYDGIGIGVFDDVIAIDIDHCVEDGKLNDFATEIVEALKTYAEFSISGTGVHIWARAPGFDYDAQYKINDSEPQKIKKEELRTYYYRNGVTYKSEVKDTKKRKQATDEERCYPIHYKMLMRSPGKAKDGECVFIRENLHHKAIQFLTMGLYD